VGQAAPGPLEIKHDIFALEPYGARFTAQARQSGAKLRVPGVVVNGENGSELGDRLCAWKIAKLIDPAQRTTVLGRDFAFARDMRLIDLSETQGCRCRHAQYLNI